MSVTISETKSSYSAFDKAVYREYGEFGEPEGIVMLSVAVPVVEVSPVFVPSWSYVVAVSVLVYANQCQQVKHRHIFTMHFCGICGILFFLVPYFLKNFASV